MNVIVSNLNKDKFSNLEVDIIKSISGEFEVEEIVQSFSNFFFNRMFLDITAIKRYEGGTFGNYEGTDYYIKQSDAIEIVKRGGVQNGN